MRYVKIVWQDGVQRFQLRLSADPVEFQCIAYTECPPTPPSLPSPWTTQCGYWDDKAGK